MKFLKSVTIDHVGSPRDRRSGAQSCGEEPALRRRGRPAQLDGDAREAHKPS